MKTSEKRIKIPQAGSPGEEDEPCVYFTVPFVPPSVNHYVKHTQSGKHYVTAEGAAYKEAVCIFAGGLKVRAKAYSVEVFVYLGSKQKGDVDNFAKCVLDGLVQAGVIDTDAKITRLLLAKFRDTENPRTEIDVRGIQVSSLGVLLSPGRK